MKSAFQMAAILWIFKVDLRYKWRFLAGTPLYAVNY